MLKVTRANHLEALADAWRRGVDGGCASPFEPEWLVVPDIGTGHWLVQQRAAQTGIAANLKALLPAEFLARVANGVAGESPDAAAYTAEVLGWRLLAALDLGTQAGPPLDYFRAQDRRGQFEFAQALGRTFERYLIYRPEWIEPWDRCATRDDWQAALWAQMHRDRAPAHWRLRLSDTLERLADGAIWPSAAPVAVFASTALSPAYLEAVAALGQFLDIELYVLDPCREYWADLVAERTRDRQSVPRREYFATGQPLLGALARPARDFIGAVHGLDAVDAEVWVEPASNTLLGRIQADLLDLRAAEPGGAMGDTSVQFHSAHTPWREAEVLHDLLLDRFESLPGLRPHEIALFVPDIDEYGTALRAVFGAAPEHLRIPVDLAGERAPEIAAWQRAIDALFDLCADTPPIERLLAPLECEAVRARFGIELSELADIEDWVRAVAMRGAPDTDTALAMADGLDFSWAQGLDRLLLGVALPAGGVDWLDWCPPVDFEGERGECLSRWLDYVSVVRELRSSWRTAADASTWIERLRALGRAGFDGEAQPDAAAVYDAALDRIEHALTVARFARELDVETLRAALDAAWASGRGSPRLSGGVVVAPIGQLRGVPFRVVCVLGLDAERFPRRDRAKDFDRLADEHRAGDPSARDDDRNALFDALAAARDGFIASWCGQHPRDDVLRPCSVALDHLLDTCVSLTGAERDALITRHPRHAFSARYFAADARLFSYRGERVPAPAVPLRPFVDARIEAAPAVEPAVIELAAFERFWADAPGRWVRTALGIDLYDRPDSLPEHEPFELEADVRIALRRVLLAQPEVSDAWLRRHLELPAGAPGRLMLQSERQLLAGMLRRRAALVGDPVAARAFELTLDGAVLTGTLDDIAERGAWSFARHSKPSARDQLALWLRHLCLCAVQRSAADVQSVVLGGDETKKFAAVDDAPGILTRLIAWYRRGQIEPLPLIAAAAMDYVEALEKAGDHDAALVAARAALEPDYRGHTPMKHAGNALVFRGRDPLAEPFAEIAIEVFGPLVGARVKGGKG